MFSRFQCKIIAPFFLGSCYIFEESDIIDVSGFCSPNKTYATVTKPLKEQTRHPSCTCFVRSFVNAAVCRCNETFSKSQHCSSSFHTRFNMRLCHFVAFLGLPLLTLSLEVTPNSVCSSRCDKNIANGADPSGTRITKTCSSDLVCNDYEYDGSSSTEAGHRFKKCLTCELSSTAEGRNSKENDVYWALCMCQFFIAV